jgi:hypothetical protein
MTSFTPQLRAFIMTSLAADVLTEDVVGHSDDEAHWQRLAPTLVACNEAYERLSERERAAVKSHPDWQPSKRPLKSTWFD